MYVPGFITPQSWSYCMTCCCQDNSMEGYWPSLLRPVNFCDSLWFCYGVNQYLRTLQSWSEYSSNRSESSDKQIMWQIKKVGCSCIQTICCKCHFSASHIIWWITNFLYFSHDLFVRWLTSFSLYTSLLFSSLLFPSSSLHFSSLLFSSTLLSISFLLFFTFLFSSLPHNLLPTHCRLTFFL